MTNCLRFLFPPVCLHCKEVHEELGRPLCKECFAGMELLDPKFRCPLCFAPLENDLDKICRECPSLPLRLASAFEYAGPAASLVRAFKYGARPDLAPGLAAFIALQWQRLNWPTPDIITPVPQSFTRWIDRGYNQSQLLAEELGKILNRPVLPLLKKQSGGFAQSGLDSTTRRQLTADTFQWKKETDISDRTLLLIDDVATTKTTLKQCASRLREGFPAKLFALTFCITDA